MEDAQRTTSRGPWYTQFWGVLILLALGIALILAGMFGFLFVRSYTNLTTTSLDFSRFNASGQLSVDPSSSTTATSEYHVVVSDDDPTLGAPTAPVSIVEFGDFECPFCQQSFIVLKAMIAEYGDDLHVQWRDFPNESIHPNALTAALAAECADDQQKFWEFHDLLFLEQDALTQPDMLRHALQLGLDTEAFRACLDTKMYRAEVEQDYQDGVRAGVRGTPTWFINGYRIEGALPAEIFRQVIEYVLDAVK